MVQLLHSIFLSGFRRWFGGYNIGGNKYEDAFFNQRWFRYIIGLLVTGLFLWYKKCNYFQIIGADCVLYFLYWAKAVGMYQDIGRDKNPDKEMIDRYNKQWYNKFLDKWFSKHKYSIIYDWFGLTIRYTLPALLLSAILLQFPIMFAGILVACGYALMWVLFDWKKINNPTEWAELIAGFITGLLL